MASHAQSTIALHTELHAECRQSWLVVYRTCHARLPSPPSAVNNRPSALASRCLYRIRRRLLCRGEIFQVQSLGQSSRGKCPYLWRCPNFLIMQRRIGHGKDVYAKIARLCSCFDTIPACGRHTHTHTHDDDSIQAYRANIASRRKNKKTAFSTKTSSAWTDTMHSRFPGHSARYTVQA